MGGGGGYLGEPLEHSMFQTLTPACTDFHDLEYALLVLQPSRRK